MTIEITATDVKAAEEFLATVVADQVPDGRFTDGTAMRDIAIKALAVVAAQFRKENATVQSLQSLLRIRQLAASSNDPAVDDAADALLSNWFITRGTGSYARGVIQIFVTRKQDYPIARTAQFFYDRTLLFYPDSDVDLVIPAADVAPLVDATGAVFAYVFSLRVVAAKTGVAYNVFPGSWAGTGGFSPYVTRISNGTRFAGGAAKQTTVDMIDQARNGIAVRNLINARSITATLTQRFGALSRLVSVGMGDPEMQRDMATDIAGGINLHVGGHFDVYVELPVSTTSFEGVLGGTYTRPDGLINVFDDTDVPDWTMTGIAPGDVIRVTAGLPSVPRDYVIKEMGAGELCVSGRNAFPTTASGVTYYIYRPLFGADVQIYPVAGSSVTGVTTNTVQTIGRMVLPAEPHYDIIDVAVLNPDPGDVNINDPDGYVHFQSRVNSTPVIASTQDVGLPFQIIGRAPANGQSALTFDELVLPILYSGKRVRVTYQTTAGFDAIDSFTRDRFERVLACNVQVKGYHPVYLGMRIGYSLSPRATGTIDQLALRQAILGYINAFDPRDIIDVSDITTFVKNYSVNIGTTYVFSIQYDLLAPDGNVYSFETADVVAMSPDKGTVDNTVSLQQLLSLTVSDRTVRYMSRLERIQIEEIIHA